MSNQKKTSSKSNLPDKKGSKPKSKQAIYSKISSFSDEIIETLLREMRAGDNSNARIGAARTLLNKVAPDLKATDINFDPDLKEKTPLVIFRSQHTNDQINELETELNKMISTLSGAEATLAQNILLTIKQIKESLPTPIFSGHSKSLSSLDDKQLDNFIESKIKKVNTSLPKDAKQDTLDNELESAKKELEELENGQST